MHVLPIRLITLPAANIHPQDKVSSINPQTISWITIYIISDIQISKSNILCNNKLLNKKTTHFTEWKRRATPNSPHPGYGVDLIVPPPWQGLKLGFFLPWFHAGFHQQLTWGSLTSPQLLHISDCGQEKRARNLGKFVCGWGLDITVAQPSNSSSTQHSIFSDTTQLPRIIGWRDETLNHLVFN